MDAENRLTIRLPSGVITRNYAIKESAMQRLAAYEDTGFTPEEVGELFWELAAAKLDIRKMLYEAFLTADSNDALCSWCKNFVRVSDPRGAGRWECVAANCEKECGWRDPRVENAYEERRIDGLISRTISRCGDLISRKALREGAENGGQDERG